MPNPSAPGDRGPCQECRSYGGPYEPEAQFGATICNDPKGSGKSVCRMPEVGCSAFVRAVPKGATNVAGLRTPLPRRTE